MTKRIWYLFLISILLLSGCKTDRSYTYDVDNDDKIRITVDPTSGYFIDDKVPFTISFDDKPVSKGTFITADSYDKYVTKIKSDDKATVIEEEELDDIKYIFYSYDDKEFNYVIIVKDSKTGVLISNTTSIESAQNCFNELSFEIIKE